MVFRQKPPEAVHVAPVGHRVLHDAKNSIVRCSKKFSRNRENLAKKV